MQVTIHWFGVEDHRYSLRPGTCRDDYLLISEAVGSDSREIDKLCGCKGLITSVSSQEKMWLDFVSFKKANWPGFYATYQTLCKYATHLKIGTLRSTMATSTKTSPQNITLLYHNSFAVILSRSLLTIWAKCPKNKLVRVVTKRK